MSIGNPAGAFGLDVFPLPASGGGIEVVNTSTSTIALNDLVSLTSTAQKKVVQGGGAAGAQLLVTALGVADETIPAGESGRVVIEGFHLIKIATAVTWAYGSALVASSSVAGGVKATTESAPGIFVGVAQTSITDTVDTDAIMAYIHKF